MTMFTFFRIQLAALALDLSIFLMPAIPEAEVSRRYIRNACTALIEALGDDDD